MQLLIQNNLRSDVQSIDNSNISNSRDQIKLDDQFSKKIQALLEYGLYDQAFERVMQNKQQVQDNFQLLIEIARLFNTFKSHKLALEIIKLSNVFDQQLDMHQDQLIIIFKQYYLETLVELQDIQEVLKETKNIYNEQVRKIIQDELHLIEAQKKGQNNQHNQQLHNSHENHHSQLTIEIPKQKRHPLLKYLNKKTLFLLFILFIITYYTIKRRSDIKQLLEKAKLIFRQFINI